MTARTDEVSMLIRAPKAIIYRALLDADARLAWLPPDGMIGRIERFDPRVGGEYRMVLTYKDPTGNAGKSAPDSDVVEARFLALVPDERVVEAIDFESEDPAFAGTMIMTWTLRAVDDGTEVRVTAAQVPEGISAEDHRAGMRSSLQNLAAFVAP